MLISHILPMKKMFIGSLNKFPKSKTSENQIPNEHKWKKNPESHRYPRSSRTALDIGKSQTKNEYTQEKKCKNSIINRKYVFSNSFCPNLRVNINKPKPYSYTRLRNKYNMLKEFNLFKRFDKY